jgi:hypothetical protein
MIKEAYDWMVAATFADASRAEAAGDSEAVDRLEMVRDILERGAFVMLFGQFETAVTETFEQARVSRSANPDWKARRGWDVPAYAARRVPFETKLALVMDRRTDVHGKIMQAYALRNHCAHGGHRETVGSIDEFVANLYVWQGLLRR